MSTRIFISYRRQDSGGQAIALGDRLKKEFGEDSVFMDVDGIPFGTDFVEVLINEVKRCSVLLVLIGPQWFDLLDKHGKRRLDDPDDFVRVEIRAALQRDKLVVPIILDLGEMPPSDMLPEDIRALCRRSGFELKHASFHPDLDRLVSELRRPPPIAVAQESQPAPGPWYWAALTFLMMLVLAVIFLFVGPFFR